MTSSASNTQPKVALITGITGQDGSYLAEFLLEKGYVVHGIKRRSSLFNTQRVDHIYEDPQVENARFKLHYGDLSDTSNLIRIVQETQPDEIYNLGAQSHVAVSFESPEYTADVDAMGTLRLLEAIRILGLEKKITDGSIRFEILCQVKPCISPENEIRVNITSKEIEGIVSSVEYVSPWA